jgi:hypothetical protein
MPDPIPNTGQARDEAAEMFGVAPRYVSDAKKIKEEAPELFEAVRSGVGSCPASSHGVRERFHSTLAGCPIPKEVLVCWADFGYELGVLKSM